MGIEPFLVASSLICVLAQRLVRIICPHCKESYTPSLQEVAYLESDIKSRTVGTSLLYRGRGCNKCMGKGYLGRTGILELLEINPDIRSMIVERKDAHAIRAVAINAGFETLRVDGIRKIINGITTIEEVLRVTQKDSEI